MSNRSCEDCRSEKGGMICLQGHVRRIRYENLNAMGHFPLEDCHAWEEKKVCWCEGKDIKIYNGFDYMKPIFCPECGKKLEA